jgi:hypothetical protein
LRGRGIDLGKEDVGDPGTDQEGQNENGKGDREPSQDNRQVAGKAARFRHVHGGMENGMTRFYRLAAILGYLKKELGLSSKWGGVAGPPKIRKKSLARICHHGMIPFPRKTGEASSSRQRRSTGL